MKKLVEIEVPEGEHCEDLGADSDYSCQFFDMNQDDEHYCQVFNRLCSRDAKNQMYALKLPECLAEDIEKQLVNIRLTLRLFADKGNWFRSDNNDYEWIGDEANPIQLAEAAVKMRCAERNEMLRAALVKIEAIGLMGNHSRDLGITQTIARKALTINRSIEEHKANVRLIASAPELLAASSDIIEYFSADFIEGTEVEKIIERLKNALEEAGYKERN